MFVNELFPNPRLIHNLERTISAETTIVTNGNLEYRLQKDTNYRTRWKWPARSMLSTDAQVLAAFIADKAKFEFNSFKFKDPYSSTWTNTELAAQGTGNRYKLTVRGTGDNHPVFHLGDDIVVKLNGTVSTYSTEVYNGVPCIVLPSAGTVTISGTFYYAVRISNTDFSQVMAALTVTNGPLADTIGDIDLIEVFEY